VSESTRTAPASLRAVRLVEFNLHPARYAHASWFPDGLPLELVSARAEPQVSTWLLRTLGLGSEFDWELADPRQRLWLLDRPSLERLALEVALAMHREWLVRIIEPPRLRALSAHVDGAALRFVVEEIPGGCFHYQAPLVAFDAAASGDLASELQAQGARTLLALLEPAWRAVRGRARLFFERSGFLEEAPGLEPELAQRALDLIVGRLIPRRFPEWAWCF